MYFDLVIPSALRTKNESQFYGILAITTSVTRFGDFLHFGQL